ncbi:24480_t:CDS:2 [Dentiscutata erythropus]|uniref:24480_t:CDS:1 n=1 Tax=Dentiscutata erythropus TaxID=1348616 RepID=A0A9N9BK86_9GLOM|nr:24480_t:CDS:2 [Dentiscutata erythropus]
MNQSTIQVIGTQPQNNSGQLQRSQNVRGSNANNQPQGTLNMPPPRPQNATNSSTSTAVAVQYDLIGGTYTFSRIQGTGNLPPQNNPSSTSLFSGTLN